MSGTTLKSMLEQGESATELQSASGEYRAIIDGNDKGRLIIQRKSNSQWVDHYRHPWTASCKNPGTKMWLKSNGDFFLWNEKGQQGLLSPNIKKVVMEDWGCLVAYSLWEYPTWLAPARIVKEGNPGFRGFGKRNLLRSPGLTYACGFVGKWLFIQDKTDNEWVWSMDVQDRPDTSIKVWTTGNFHTQSYGADGTQPTWTLLSSGVEYADLTDEGKLVAYGSDGAEVWSSTNDNPRPPRVFPCPGTPSGTPPGSNPPSGTYSTWNPGAPGFFSANNIGMWTYIAVLVAVILGLVYMFM